MPGPCTGADLLLQPATQADLPSVVALMNTAFRGAGPAASWNTEAEHIDGDRTSVELLTEEIAANPEAVMLLSRSACGNLLGTVWLETAGGGGVYLGSRTIATHLPNAR